jgi:hypothetical protein
MKFDVFSDLISLLVKRKCMAHLAPRVQDPEVQSVTQASRNGIQRSHKLKHNTKRNEKRLILRDRERKRVKGSSIKKRVTIAY